MSRKMQRYKRRWNFVMMLRNVSKVRSSSTDVIAAMQRLRKRRKTPTSKHNTYRTNEHSQENQNLHQEFRSAAVLTVFSGPMAQDGVAEISGAWHGRADPRFLPQELTFRTTDHSHATSSHNKRAEPSEPCHYGSSAVG
jgi:hypothetical protein